MVHVRATARPPRAASSSAVPAPGPSHAAVRLPRRGSDANDAAAGSAAGSARGLHAAAPRCPSGGLHAAAARCAARCALPAAAAAAAGWDVSRPGADAHAGGAEARARDVRHRTTNCPAAPAAAGAVGEGFVIYLYQLLCYYTVMKILLVAGRVAGRRFPLPVGAPVPLASGRVPTWTWVATASSEANSESDSSETGP